MHHPQRRKSSREWALHRSDWFVTITFLATDLKRAFNVNFPLHFQARQAQENALKEDPTIYQYDELYDEMSTTREEAKKSKTTQSKDSKYIGRLLQTAEKRKKEYERRIERQVQKEREAEGDKYKDKEVFVTSTYRAKLEEMKKAEEADEREAYLENIGDVTKQKDLDGFYRHLYEQKMGNEKAEPEAASNDKEVNTEKEASTSKDALESISKQKKQRTYRRRLSNDDEEIEGERKEDGGGSKAHLPSNLDADSDFSIDSESDDDSKTGDGDKPKKLSDEKPLVLVDQIKPAEEIAAQNKTPSEPKVPEHDFVKPDAIDDKKEPTPEPEEEPVEVKEVKIKIDIWKKRTVGDIFDAALQRYYERKQLRAN